MFEVSVKIFFRKWDEGILSEWFFDFKQLEKWESEYYPEKLTIFHDAKQIEIYFSFSTFVNLTTPSPSC